MIPNALGSAAAGIIGRIFTHPLDTAKARLQAVYAPSTSNASRTVTVTNPYKGPIDALLQTARTEGIHGLYRGFGAVILGGTPGTVIYLCSYEIAKTKLSTAFGKDADDQASNSDFVVHFAAGMIAETISCIIYVPVDVIKERMQVQQQSQSVATNTSQQLPVYRNTWDALKTISKTEGLSGIYRGYGATLASFGPFSALYFVFYERLKQLAKQQHVEDQLKQQQALSSSSTSLSRRQFETVELPFQWLVLSSATAGALASWLTSPLDMAKLRLQVSRGTIASASSSSTTTKTTVVQYRGVVDCLQWAYQDGGVKGLFRGAGARVLHYAPATTITMTSYEVCKAFISKHLDQ